VGAEILNFHLTYYCKVHVYVVHKVLTPLRVLSLKVLVQLLTSTQQRQLQRVLMRNASIISAKIPILWIFWREKLKPLTPCL